MGKRSKKRVASLQSATIGTSIPAPAATRRAILGGLVVCALVAGVYGRSVAFGFTHTDDTVLLRDDARFISDTANLPHTLTRPFFSRSSRGEGYFRPLVTGSFFLDARWNGIEPAAFHAANVAYHALASCLFFILLGQLGFTWAVSFVGALIFSVHPAIAEAIYWIPGRCDVFLGIGFLTSTMCFLAYTKAKQPGFLLGHLLGLALALMSKETGLVIPLVVVAYVLGVQKRPALLRDPRLLTGWGTVLLGWYALWSSASPRGTGEGLGQRLETAFSNLPVLLVYLGKSVLPVGLSVLAHAHDSSIWVGLSALAGGTWAASQLSGSRRRLFVWGGLVFTVALLPTLAVSDFLILENRLYVPAMGIVIASMVLMESLQETGTSWVKSLVPVCAVFIVGFFSLLTWQYGRAFRDAQSFTAQAIVTSPRLALAHLNRGIVLQLEGRVPEAEQEYRTALTLDQSQPVVHNNLGLIDMNRGKLPEAQASLRQEITLNPGYDKAHFNLGLVLAREGRLQEALVSWREALRLNPDNEEARKSLSAGERSLTEGTAPVDAEPTQVSGDEIPSELMVSLYEDALKKQPNNKALRQAFLDLCRRRRLPCADSRRE